ncbi:diguanylate cyclase [Rhodanobacter sp. FW102-FHT14D06]|uniref:diguanylate cyclase n=2 Tax=unclassified Rhodanobacter TaxID=2621553 RepID=A0AB74UQZ0_9GAMM
MPLSIASAATNVVDPTDSAILGSGYRAGLNLSDADLTDLRKSENDYFISTPQGQIHQSIENLRQSASEFYRPDPQTTGFVGNTLFGAADVLTRVGLGNLVAPGSGLALAAGTTGVERTQDLEAQDVDAATAQASGALTGVSLLAGGGISSLGKTVTAKVVSGALLNAGFGAGTRALDSSILAAAGYTAQADQQRWNDGAALAADIIIGGAFHLLPSRGEGVPAKPPADTVDAALAAKATQGVTDSAPGVPADPKSASAHVTALDTAQAQLLDGQPVEVEPIVREATFVPRETAPPERTMPEVGSIIDNHLAALDDQAKQRMMPDAVKSMAKEGGELEDLLREQYRARENNVMQSADSMLTPAEVSFAEDRLQTIRQQLEQHKQGMAAESKAANLRKKLSRTDTDPELRDIAQQIAPESTPEIAARQNLRDALAEAGVPAEQLDTGAPRPPESVELPGIEPAPYEARLTELRDRRRQGVELTPTEQGELLDLQEQDARQAKVAGQPIAGVQNMAGRAEAERAGNLLPVQVFADADNFKDLNDNLGHETGDVVIRQIGALMARELGEGNVFHRGGDEFVAQGRTEAEVTAAMERVRDRLAKMDLKATFEDGSEARQTGVGLSYGHGPDVKTAEKAQYADKQRRKDAGLRTDRRESERRSADRGRDGAPVDRRGQTPGEARTGQPGRVTPRDAAEAPTPGTDAARAGAEPAQQGTSRSDAAGQPGAGLDPARAGEVDRARAAAAAHPDAVLADGATAADALRSADHDVEQAQTQGEAIAAAVACFLRFGSEAA